MMNILIKNIIDEIVGLFGKEIESIKYQFMGSSNTHFIEINSANSVLDSVEFSQKAFEWIYMFMDHKDGGILSFLKEDSLTVLDSPEYINITSISTSNANVHIPQLINIFTGNVDETFLLCNAGEESYAFAA